MSVASDARLGLISMLLLVFQGTALSIALRYASADRRCVPSVLVAITEALKLLVCTLMHAADVLAGAKLSLPGVDGGSRRQRLVIECREIVRGSLPMVVPAILFVVQQLLVIVAGSNLSAVMFQVFSQSFKIVPTAFFAVWLLDQRLSPQQWLSLPVLVAGVILVTYGKSKGGSGVDSHGSWVMGMLASSLSGVSSAFAGVYVEKFLKGDQAPSLYVRNMQLSLYGAPVSFFYALLKDGQVIRAQGLFFGCDRAAWCVIALQVLGGLIVALVVKYTDNIVKNFANAVSVICTVLVSVLLFDMTPSLRFVGGVSLVLLAVGMYGGACTHARRSGQMERLSGGKEEHRNYVDG